MTTLSASHELLELARHLKQEHLFVLSEKQLLLQLHEEVTQLADKLFRMSWITQQQRQTLNSLTLTRVDVPPNYCCYRANALEKCAFVDSYKHLGFQDTLYGEFLGYLRDNPKAVALCLVLGEKEQTETAKEVVRSIMSAVYGNCIVQEDEQRALHLLQYLMEQQLADSDDPRRLIRRGTCAISLAFRLFTEGLFSTRLYLTAALHEPIMSVLMDDDVPLETDPQKALDHFTPEERELRFGTPGTEEYRQCLQAHLESIVTQLVAMCNRFIDGLRNNAYCFPQSLDWIITQLHQILLKSGRVEPLEVRATCADLLMNFFVCPVIVNPESYGVITDIMISSTARFNLMQVGQILQGLAMDNSGSTTPAQASDIYSRFPKGCMSSFLDTLIDNMSSSDAPPGVSQLQGMTRTSALITETELHNMVSFFRMVTTANPNEPALKELDSLLSNLPHTFASTPGASLTPHSGLSPKVPSGSSSPKIGSGHGPITKKTGSSLKGSKKSLGGSIKVGQNAQDEDEGLDASISPDTPPVPQPEDVLVVAFGNQGNECPGMLSEAKVLSSNPSRPKPKLSPTTVQGNLAAISEQPEKQLRFSDDADASGNSDHLMEAMSIVASEYSVDLEGEMASNLSGRNTPRSAVSLASSSTDHNRPDLIDSTQLPNNANITDRFGKFEIGDALEKKKAQGNPETFSETWSTEVIGSDTSEPPSEPNPIERLQEIAESQEDIELAGAQAASLLGIRHSAPDISETASETWSVDVLQSDSEPPEDRMQEVEDVAHEEAIQASLLEADTDRTSSKTSDGPSSRRSSSDSPSVDDGAIKKDTSSDATEDSNTHYFDPMEDPSMLKGSSPMGPSSSSSSQTNNDHPEGFSRKPLPPQEEFMLRRSSPLVDDRQRKLSKEDRPFSSFLDQFDPVGIRNNYTLRSGAEPSGTAPAKPDSKAQEDLLQDFDPFAALSARSSSTLPPSIGRQGDIPLGAKPKKRSNSTQKISSRQAGYVSYNELHGLNQDFGAPGRQQRSNPFDLVHDGLSHVNHGFFEPSVPSTQPDPFQPDVLTPFGNLDPAAPVSHTSQSLFALQPQQQNASYRTPGLDSDSGMVSADSSEHLSNRVVSSISTASSSSASFLNVSLESSAKPPDFLAQIGGQASDDWSGLEQRESGRVQSFPSTSSGSSFGLGPTGSTEMEQKQGSNVLFQRSNSTDASYLIDDNKAKLDVGDSDKSRSWLKKKVIQIHKIAARKPSKKHGTVAEREDREKDREWEQEKKHSEVAQIIPNLALVQHTFKDDGLKAASVPETSSEDILNKYRGLQRSQSSELLESDHLGHELSNLESSTESSGSRSCDKPDSGGGLSDPPDVEPENLEESYAFLDAKRKLRIVLRSADVHSLPWLTNLRVPERAASERALGISRGYPENKLVAFLKVQLAEAMNLQDRSLMAQLRETLRCIQAFDNDGCGRLLACLREDYENRAPYIAYLVRSRKGLASSRAHLHRLLDRVERDKAVVNKYFTMVLVRLFLERQERSVLKFIEDFKALTAADEKTQLVKFFLTTLNNWIIQDPIWEAASDAQMNDAEVATERAIMSRIYKLAVYPNDEADVARDRVLQAHIFRLSRVITVNHKALQIPEKYGREAPWPAAQAEILNINVYKTPKDKLGCIYRCCKIIMNLLSLANENSAVGADDFSPVLMYVLIKANPPSLLSTVQYVNSFYFEGEQSRENGDGEEQYWWMQFCAAIEYIKTLDDRK
ncbi:GTPase-activating protein and VPS9 domain-containing protein 1-like [Acanthaster planci]|uniref:GTPase-activating protein and VPS9 domain-containing protein 1-like n=1 Tax=Acanthaster planci TaxID=133434 RepID=A0A8B7ZYX0_ACAPL|nr:GTPase-activating protein and VPS9 domain-containing protein 1-like [Acanthaster planci]XP_022110620.1 GTPase-activating protein and VPS9 domain-containing protein 1-like [Acanthaster planci]XP_022110621.1 GTPase-activating protein and VPS9 domain-containing protein 1-like [Acanthaster planci]